MCEAGRRAKMSVCFAAEKNRTLHADYHYNTGVVPYNSNEELLQEIPDDIDVYLFGSNCRSVSRAGLKRGLGQTDVWKEFDRVVTHMRNASVKACLYECSDDFITDTNANEYCSTCSTPFDAAGFTTKYSVVCPTQLLLGYQQNGNHHPADKLGSMTTVRRQLLAA